MQSKKGTQEKIAPMGTQVAVGIIRLTYNMQQVLQG
jgi:hypothetical protein